MSDHGPVNIIPSINRLVRTARQLFQETGQQPTEEEIAERSGIPTAAVHRLLEIARRPITLHP